MAQDQRPDAKPGTLASTLTGLLSGIDRGVQAHVAWNQKIVRCALLHASPGEDMLGNAAHEACEFGQWLKAEMATLAGFDPAVTLELVRQHHAMHDAARVLCGRLLNGETARVQDIQAYEAGQSAMVGCLNALRQHLSSSAQQLDALTGLPLRNGLGYLFELRQRDASRQGVPLHLAMVDVDHFKRVNDTWGHPVGDLALQHLARVLTQCLRDNDVVVRFGGEEFLFLLLGHDAEGVVKRILDEVRSHPMTLANGSALCMTVTAGLTAVTEADTLDDAIDRADHALLQGKQSGRDRYMLA